jgi:multidrug efflux pump subunit AcrB
MSKCFLTRPQVAVMIAIVLVLAGAVRGKNVKTRRSPLCSPSSRLVL